MTLIELLNDARERLTKAGVDTPLLDAEILLAHATGMRRIDLYMNRSEAPSAERAKIFEEMLCRRIDRCPVAYITGVREFWSIPIRVTPDVLIPRPETELVVEEALKAMALRRNRGDAVAPTILDLCTGSGCIAAALATEIPDATLTATDVSPAALEVARSNLSFAEGRVKFLVGDLFEALPPANLASGGGSVGRGPFDMIVSNPPYVPDGDRGSMAPEIVRHEPEGALYGGESGLDFALRIIEDAPLHMKSGGALVMEIGFGQAEKLKAAAAGLSCCAGAFLSKDLAGIERVITIWKN